MKHWPVCLFSILEVSQVRVNKQIAVDDLFVVILTSCKPSNSWGMTKGCQQILCLGCRSKEMVFLDLFLPSLLQSRTLLWAVPVSPLLTETNYTILPVTPVLLHLACSLFKEFTKHLRKGLISLIIALEFSSDDLKIETFTDLKQNLKNIHNVFETSEGIKETHPSSAELSVWSKFNKKEKSRY